MLTFPFKALRQNADAMGLALPGPDEPGARLKPGSDRPQAGSAGFVARGVIDLPKPALGRFGEPAKGVNLDLIGEAPQQQLPPEKLRGWALVKRQPSFTQIGRAEIA